MKKVLIALLTVIIIAVLGLGGFIIWQLGKKIDKQNEDISTLINEIRGSNENATVNNTATNTATNDVINNSQSNQTVNNNASNNQTQQPTNNNQTTVASMEEQVKNAYAQKISQSSNVAEYRIESVIILTDEQKKSLLEYDKGQYYKETDTLANVRYSVKLKDMKGEYSAGNGEVNGDWMINKSACVCYRDGQIVSDGTGW